MGQPERGYSLLRIHRPSKFIFFLPHNQSLPGNCLLLATATLRIGESREGRLPLLLLNGDAYSSIPVVTRLRLKPVFSNKSFLSNRLSLIPASIEAEKKPNPPWQLPNATVSRRASGKSQTNPIVPANPKEPK